MRVQLLSSLVAVCPSCAARVTDAARKKIAEILRRLLKNMTMNVTLVTFLKTG
jgi:hypothetical protein